MFDKFIFFLMVSHPNTFQCILAIIVVAVFAGLYGWPIFLLLGLCVLLLIVSYYLDKKVVKLNDKSTDEELARAEKSSKWLMALLSFFALLGNIIGFFVVLWSLEHDSKSTTTISALFVFQFMFLGIPYILMSFVKRKSSFWYGLMASALLFSFIQFFVIYFMLESEKPLLAEHAQWEYEFVKGDWLVSSLSVFHILFFMDSLCKAFGLFIKYSPSLGYDKEKHRYSIIKNYKLSAIGMAISLVWSLLSLGYCYYYLTVTRVDPMMLYE